jgi:nucleotide-binding universal stress UspA family protein
MPGAVERPVDHPLQAAAGRLKVLLATDGADESAAACRLLQNLSLPPGSALRILSIVDEPTVPGPGCPPFGIPWNTMEEDLEHDQGGAREAIRYAGALVSSTDFSVTARVREGNPVTEILREAEALDADLVVVGSRGLTGLRGLMHRSVARAVVERCQRPVLMARAPRNELREVIVALDGSVHARNAAEFFCLVPAPGCRVEHTPPRRALCEGASRVSRDRSGRGAERYFRAARRFAGSRRKPADGDSREAVKEGQTGAD